MSLILDALNRADRERKNSQPTPDINTVHEVSYRGGASLSKVWLIGGAVLVAVVILLVYLLLQARQQMPAVTPSLPVAREVAAPPVTETSARKVEAPSAVAPVNPQETPAGQPATAAKPSEEVHSLYAEPGAPVVDDKINDLYKPVEEPAVVESVPVQVPAVTSVSLLDKAPAETATEEISTDNKPAANNPSDGSTRTYNAIHNAPDLRQLPWSVQQEIPSIIYSQHNFTGDSTSNVVLNGQPRRVGNQVGGELNLEEIYVDGILLRFREHRFKLRALNNWVNM